MIKIELSTLHYTLLTFHWCFWPFSLASYIRSRLPFQYIQHPMQFTEQWPLGHLLPPNETSLRIYCTKPFLFQINLSCHDISLVQITSPGIGTAVRQACMVHKKTKWRVWCIRKRNGVQKNQTLMRPKMRPSRIILRLVLWLLILRVQSRVSDYHSNRFPVFFWVSNVRQSSNRAVTNLVAMASEIYFATKFRRKSSIGDHQIKKKKKKRKTISVSLFFSLAAP